MPLYEYTCEQCDNEFELLIRSSNDQPACPTCGTKKVTKQLSVPAAHVGGANSLPVCEAPRDPNRGRVVSPTDRVLPGRAPCDDDARVSSMSMRSTTCSRYARPISGSVVTSVRQTSTS
jgi:putative FmdB family regulatory protein